MEACCSSSSSILTLRPIKALSPLPKPSFLFYPSPKPSLSSLHSLSLPLFTRPPTPRRKPTPISAVFERFTERAIKAVVLSQREARTLGKQLVFPQHLLLGLVAEDPSPDGFLGSGIRIGSARDAVKRIWNDVEEEEGEGEGAARNLPFSVSSKRVFEAAVELSRSTGCNFIAPEHVAVGLFTADDGSSGLVLNR